MEKSLACGASAKAVNAAKAVPAPAACRHAHAVHAGDGAAGRGLRGLRTISCALAAAAILLALGVWAVSSGRANMGRCLQAQARTAGVSLQAFQSDPARQAALLDAIDRCSR